MPTNDYSGPLSSIDLLEFQSWNWTSLLCVVLVPFGIYEKDNCLWCVYIQVYPRSLSLFFYNYWSASGLLVFS